MHRIPIYRVKLVRDGSQAVERKKVVSPVTAANLLHEYLDGADREHFVVLLLDTHHQIIGIHTVTAFVYNGLRNRVRLVVGEAPLSEGQREAHESDRAEGAPRSPRPPMRESARHHSVSLRREADPDRPWRIPVRSCQAKSVGIDVPP